MLLFSVLFSNHYSIISILCVYIVFSFVLFSVLLKCAKYRQVEFVDDKKIISVARINGVYPQCPTTGLDILFVK